MICLDLAYDILSKLYPFSTKRKRRNSLNFIICKVTNNRLLLLCCRAYKVRQWKLEIPSSQQQGLLVKWGKDPPTFKALGKIKEYFQKF